MPTLVKANVSDAIHAHIVKLMAERQHTKSRVIEDLLALAINGQPVHNTPTPAAGAGAGASPASPAKSSPASKPAAAPRFMPNPPDAKTYDVIWDTVQGKHRIVLLAEDKPWDEERLDFLAVKLLDMDKAKYVAEHGVAWGVEALDDGTFRFKHDHVPCTNTGDMTPEQIKLMRQRIDLGLLDAEQAEDLL